TDQRVQRRSTFFDGGEFMRSALVEVGEIGGQLQREVRQPVADVGDALGDAGQLRVGGALEVSSGFGDQHGGIGLALFAGDGTAGEGGRDSQLFGVGELLGARKSVV